ncbi:GNAT family N-acetyltransferase [Micromonospora sp. RTGN7]|uniref:GNAT family N-acetyltransferase n=1 Tax=Micromonospora sp. RTGN7 TaxID=3016526 RepID=UPI0029FF2262|nr:GNAT family N-acetyltransferase [Micromonospora sp. RTGN7]
MAGVVKLEPVDERNLEPLLSVAVAEAEPDDVMPPVDAPAGWSHARREAFRVYYRTGFAGFEGPARTRMYAILVGGEVLGMIRMTRCPAPGTVETGLWLGRSARGQGVGVAALRELLNLAAAAGMRTVVAYTTRENVGAVSVLCGCGAVLAENGDTVRAEISLDAIPPAR